MCAICASYFLRKLCVVGPHIPAVVTFDFNTQLHLNLSAPFALVCSRAQDNMPVIRTLSKVAKQALLASPGCGCQPLAVAVRNISFSPRQVTSDASFHSVSFSETDHPKVLITGKVALTAIRWVYGRSLPAVAFQRVHGGGVQLKVNRQDDGKAQVVGVPWPTPPSCVSHSFECLHWVAMATGDAETLLLLLLR